MQQAFFENKPLEKTKKDPKRLSVERIYQKKTQLEHILLRPDSYIGSVEPVTQVRCHTGYIKYDYTLTANLGIEQSISDAQF